MDQKKIEHELKRLGADRQVRVASDREFEPEAGELLYVEIDSAYWHMVPQEFLELLSELPDGAGADRIKGAIEGAGVGVWHGPAPDDDRDHPV